METEDAELRERLRDALRESGGEDALKAQMRVQLVRLFQQRHPSASPSVAAAAERKSSSSSAVRGADGVVAAHLRAMGYDLALSVFAAECGGAPPSPTEAAALLAIPPRVFDASAAGDSPLCAALAALSAAESEGEGSATATTVEQRLARHRRRCEEAAERRAEARVAAFAQGEGARIRAEEAARAREEVARVRARLDAELRERDAREAELQAAARRAEEERGRRDFEARQQLLSRMDALRKDADAARAELKAREDRLARREAELDARVQRAEAAERDLLQRRTELEQRLEQERSAFAIDRARAEKERLLRAASSLGAAPATTTTTTTTTAAAADSSATDPRLKRAVRKLREKVAILEKEKAAMALLHDDELADVQESCRDEVERLSAEWKIHLKELDADRHALEEELANKDAAIAALQREIRQMAASPTFRGRTGIGASFGGGQMTMSSSDSPTRFGRTMPTMQRHAATFTSPSTRDLGDASASMSLRQTAEQMEQDTDFVEQEIRRAREEADLLEREAARLSQRASMSSTLNPPTAPTFPPETTWQPRHTPSPAAAPRVSSPVQAAAPASKPSSWLDADDGARGPAPAPVPAPAKAAAAAASASAASWLDADDGSADAAAAAAQVAADRARKEREEQALREIQETMEAQRRERERKEREEAEAAAAQVTQEEQAALDALDMLDL